MFHSSNLYQTFIKVEFSTKKYGILKWQNHAQHTARKLQWAKEVFGVEAWT